MDLIRPQELSKAKDMISTLPDDVLIHILSRLTTKDAIKTSVLSSRWKNLWTLTYNLYFDDMPFWLNKNYETYSFVSCVDKVLSLWQAKDIQDFHLSCSFLEHGELSSVEEWICFAIEHKVSNVSLEVDIGEKWGFRLPQSILTCKTLVELSLGSDFFLDIPDSVVCFPSLKILCVKIVYPDGNLMQKLFRSCPILEDLSINGSRLCHDHLVPMFDITVPTVKRLKIELDMDYSDYKTVSNQYFVITAPNLEYLYIQDFSLACIKVNEYPLLNEVSLHVGVHLWREHSMEIHEDEALRAMQLLSAIHNTKILSLTFCTTNVLSMYFDGNMPIFPNLTHLNLGIDAVFGWKLLPHFLSNSPNLQVLILEKEVIEWYCDEVDDEAERNFVWFQCGSVPLCLRFHLKEIHIKRMRWIDDELQVIKYLLRNSQVLEKFSVDFTEFGPNRNIQRQIRNHPKGSDSCRIEFL
ncbi:hypothetical protein JRO89_XS02G0083000 [Xanthoceras sorbifolium]|uniref:F-box domain-containing protein n=1 Tax=Xanthoceras sorbifolium TaxID=99658 RepID=A0ABQ8IFS4_9ROSI|nr:hypothetical protein JRO89_XS02G0083000 [Xanthoceras sorbifolium]